MQWVLIGELFSALARASNSVGAQPAIPRWLDMIAAFIEQGNVAATELNALKAHIQQMVVEDRPPTDDEWAALEARSDAAHETIQEADLTDNDGGTGEGGDGTDGDGKPKPE